MLPTWVVQSNLPGSDTLRLLRRACDDIGFAVHEVSITPRQPSLPIDLPAAPLIVHGATTLVTLASADRRFLHGVFCDLHEFTHSAYQREFGTAYLNHAAELVTWDQAIAKLNAGESFFVKPPDDLKAFTGFVATKLALQKKLETLSKHPEILPERIVIGPCHEVDAEWRLFIVGRKIISGSMYRPSADSYIPSDLIDFASHAIQTWQPAPVFVLDVARVCSHWKIVECNCFSWSRFYESDVTSIVRAVSEYQLDRLNSAKLIG
jgi:hypothetical protein